MDELISRKAIEKLKKYRLSYDTNTTIPKSGIFVKISDLKELPSVTPQLKIGKWIWQTEDIYRCSECGEDIHVKEVMNVPQYVCCPMCEAKMEVE